MRTMLVLALFMSSITIQAEETKGDWKAWDGIIGEKAYQKLPPSQSTPRAHYGLIKDAKTWKAFVKASRPSRGIPQNVDWNREVVVFVVLRYQQHNLKFTEIRKKGSRAELIFTWGRQKTNFGFPAMFYRLNKKDVKKLTLKYRHHTEERLTVLGQIRIQKARRACDS